jgi:hypothetical protein
MPIPTVPPSARLEAHATALVRSVGPQDVDVLWGRPIFKAPPLEFTPRPRDLASAVAVSGGAATRAAC